MERSSFSNRRYVSAISAGMLSIVLLLSSCAASRESRTAIHSESLQRSGTEVITSVRDPMRMASLTLEPERMKMIASLPEGIGVQKKENGVLSVPSELLLTAGIPLDCDLMIETVPGVILIGIEDPVQTVCEPYLKVFDELGIELNEVEALMGKEKRTR